MDGIGSILDSMKALSANYRTTLFHVAAREGRIDVLKELCKPSLRNNSVVFKKDESYRTPLHLAKNKHVAKLLVEYVHPLKQRQFILATKNWTPTALHSAVEDGRIDVVEYLCNIQFPGDELILAGDDCGYTAVHYAKSKDIAQLLVQSVNDPVQQRNLLLATGRNQVTALHLAAGKNNIDMVRYLCEASKGDIDVLLAKDDSGVKAVHYTACVGIAKLLVEYVGPSRVEELIVPLGYSGFHRLASGGHTDVIRYFYEFSLPDDLLLRQSELGRTALHNVKNAETAKLLVEHVKLANRRRFVFCVNNRMQTALHCSVESNKADVVEYLCNIDISEIPVDYCEEDKWEKEADDGDYCMNDRITAQDSRGRTALHEVLSESVAEILISGVKHPLSYITENLDKKGNTPLMLAAVRCPEALAYLLDYIEMNFEDSTNILRREFERTNVDNQNILHITSSSEKMQATFDVLEQFMDYITVRAITTYDVYNNTPFNYMASRFATKHFASFIIKMPLACRQSMLRVSNVRDVDCLQIVERSSFSKEFYRESVLCGEHTLYAQTLYLNSAYRIPQEFPNFDENILRVVKYSLNEYSLLDSAYTISHTLFSKMVAQFLPHVLSLKASKDGNASTKGAAVGSPILYIDADRLDTRDLTATQSMINQLDVPENHGLPKVVLATQNGAASTLLRLVPPGPDFLLVSVEYICTPPNALFDTKTCLDVESLVDDLRSDRKVRKVDVNSTLCRKFHKCKKNIRTAPTQENSDSDAHTSSIALINGTDRGITGADRGINGADRGINGTDRGKMLIISNSHNREGWEEELNDCKKVFGGYFGLEITVEKALSADKMVEVIAKFALQPEHGTAVGLAIMSHGDENGNICGNSDIDDDVCSVQAMVDSLYIPRLETTPKILMLSFCRGSVEHKTRNRTVNAWECRILPSLAESTSFSPVRKALEKNMKEKVWAEHLFPSVGVPLNCYIHFSTLPDSKVKRGRTFNIFADYLATIISAAHIVLGSSERSSDVKRSSATPSTGSTDSKCHLLPRVELITMFTDLAAVIRERSNFTHYTNHCYSVDGSSRKVIIEILPV